MSLIYQHFVPLLFPLVYVLKIGRGVKKRYRGSREEGSNINFMEQKQEQKNKVGRPPKYNPEFCNKVDEYLEECQDYNEQVVKQANADKGYEMYDHKLKVRLPTFEGFMKYINIASSTLYDWKNTYPEFSEALEKILIEQKQRLLDNGLSGDYNPTIAKLILSSNHDMAEKTKTDHTTGGEKLQGNTIVFESFKNEASS